MKFRHSTLMLFFGVVWFIVGVGLLQQGLKLLVNMSQLLSHNALDSLPLARPVAFWVGGLVEAAIVLIAFGLIVGYFKGRFILHKSVVRALNRLRTYPNPASLGAIYSPAYFILIIGMACLGMLISYFRVPADIRGFIDTAVGAALINGAVMAFRCAGKLKLQVKTES